LLDLSGGEVAEAAQEWADRVDTVVSSIEDYPVRALLIRPDGYVAWAADDFGADDEGRLATALSRWFGSAE
jgi:hypothetical protein